jgi:uncharacterized cupin superfamily protein
MKPAIEATAVSPATRPAAPEPFASRLGAWEGRSLGDYFALTQFGVNLEIVQPGCESALRHWHTRSDEFIYVLEGKLTLVTDDGEATLTPGMCIGFKAGVQNAHHLINRTSNSSTFLVIGTRIDGDEVHYPDDDFQWLPGEDGDWYAAKRDGTRL